MKILKDIKAGEFDLLLSEIAVASFDRQDMLDDLAAVQAMKPPKKNDDRQKWERAIIRFLWKAEGGDPRFIYHFNDKRKTSRRRIWKSTGGCAKWKRVLTSLEEYGIKGYSMWGNGPSTVLAKAHGYGSYLTEGIVRRETLSGRVIPS